MELKSGTLLRNGEYRICEVLGQGGFGITYLGEQISLERKVAIKEFFMKELCNRDMDTSQISVGSHGSIDVVERFRQKFIKEARNIAKLKHRNIISIIDIFEDNGTAYYVMEYVEGGSLADKVSEGALPVDVAVRYIRQVASALALVHSKHMMHLDIKPANILVDEDDNAVLIDFGLSKRYDNEGHQTSTTPVGLSHGYAPMEQYRRGGVSSFSPATDIYSLGATLYKLVTGIRPPEADEVINDGLPDISYLSLPVRKAIETSMRFVIKERPQSVGEFLEVLDGNGSGTPLAASTVTDETVAPVVDESRVSAGAGRDKTVGDSSEETLNSAVDSVWHKKDKREKKDDNWLDDERFNDLKKWLP